MSESQPGYLLKMRAKPGRGEELRELTNKSLQGSSDIESWLICSVDDDPDAFWFFEFFKDDETLASHEANQDLGDSHHKAIFELLGEPPVRVVVRPVAASGPLLQA